MSAVPFLALRPRWASGRLSSAMESTNLFWIHRADFTYDAERGSLSSLIFSIFFV